MLRQGLSHLAFANLIAAAIAVALAEPIVRLLFERGMFGPSATHRVALALVETLSAKMRIFRVPEFLAAAFLLAVIGMLVQILLTA